MATHMSIAGLIAAWQKDAAERQRQSKHGSSMSSMSEDIGEGMVARRMLEMIEELNATASGATSIRVMVLVEKPEAAGETNTLQNLLELETPPTLGMKLWLGHSTPGAGIWGVVEEICTVPVGCWLMHPEIRTVLRVSLIREEDHSLLETRPGWTQEDWDKTEKAMEDAPEEKLVTLLGSF